MNTRLKKSLLIMFFILLALVLIGVSKGAVNIPLNQLLLKENLPIVYLRILRVITAIAAGCGLAVAGIVLQAILRNPLAEPYLLGSSSGAGLGAVIALLIGISRLYLPLAAFLGAACSILLVYAIARENNKLPEQSLILSGVIVSVALSALIVFLISVSGNETLHDLTWWLWGSFQVYDIKLLFIVTVVVLLGSAAIYVFAQDLNAISIGEEEAVHLGIDIEPVKKILILIASLITASLVCVCGIIGFVGLIIPHMMRLLAGPNHKTLIPVSCIAAGIFMVGCDILSRVILPPLEIPIGVITAILGAPAFIILLKKGREIK